MEYNFYDTCYPDYLMHYGVKGMKWGHRKAQAFSVKAAGHRAMAKVYDINAKTYQKSNKALSSMNASARTQQLKKAEQAQAEANAKREARNTPEAKAKRAKAMKIGAAIAGTALAAYGAKKVHDMIRDKNRDIRVGKELAEANFLLKSNSLSESSYGKGLTNAQIKYKNDQFNKLSKEMLTRAQASGNWQADHDSFTTAVKNVYNDRRRR